jgi:hypothetical protein
MIFLHKLLCFVAKNIHLLESLMPNLSITSQVVLLGVFDPITWLSVQVAFNLYPESEDEEVLFHFVCLRTMLFIALFPYAPILPIFELYDPNIYLIPQKRMNPFDFPRHE